VVADRVGETDCVFLASLYRAERAIAERLLKLAAGKLPWPPIDADKAIPWIEQRVGLTLAESQKVAVRLALASRVLVITGGLGVGNTTIVNSILRILASKGARLKLCAPTGRAAKRMSEATSPEAKTIHRLLEVAPKGGGFRRDAESARLRSDRSRRNVDGGRDADARTPRGSAGRSAMLVVGDVDQLPSVGPGQVLADA
jgi:exodeoxyribonuclease V alpha subunit